GSAGPAGRLAGIDVGRRPVRPEAEGGAGGGPPRAATDATAAGGGGPEGGGMSAPEPGRARPGVDRADRRAGLRHLPRAAPFAAWWGAGSEIDARPGGVMRIRYPNGVLASGEVLEVVPHERVVFTYGYEDASRPLRPGGSRVTVTLDERPEGTLVRLRHELP